MKDFLNEIHQIARFEPAIVERIDEDLDLYAKKKKLLRLADAQFLQGQTPDLPKLQLQLHELKLEEIELETGRPRTDAYVVYVFLMLRGFNGGCKDQQARLLLEESLTLKLWLEHLGLELPPASTLSDNLNAVSNATRGFIEQAQLRYIFEQGLDDFGKCFIDSTAVEANTDRPTDSALMVKLIRRICALGGHLHRLGLPDMNQVGLEEQQEELRRMSQQILFLNGKARGQGRRQKLYFQLIRRVRRLRKRLLRDIEPVRQNLESRSDLLPSRRLMAQEAVSLLADDLQALEQSANVCERRTVEEEKVPVDEKIISLSDPDAGFIVKGDGTAWSVTARNWRAAGAALSPPWCCQKATGWGIITVAVLQGRLAQKAACGDDSERNNHETGLDYGSAEHGNPRGPLPPGGRSPKTPCHRSHPEEADGNNIKPRNIKWLTPFSFRSPADSPPKNSPEKSTSPTAPPWHTARARPPTTSANCEPRA